jgi:hypothetical protein
MPAEKAFNEIRERLGTQFDPEAGQAFLGLRTRVEELIQQYFGGSHETVTPDRFLERKVHGTDQLRLFPPKSES